MWKLVISLNTCTIILILMGVSGSGKTWIKDEGRGMK
jgi:ABC-type proline/glycine betaine transport system ATPase subunit